MWQVMEDGRDGRSKRERIEGVGMKEKEPHDTEKTAVCFLSHLNCPL